MSDDHPTRRLPSVRAVLDRPVLAPLIASDGRESAAHAVRLAIGEARASMIRGELVDSDLDRLARRALALASADRPTLRPVLNATGILLNTGLGRTPMADEAAEAVARIARGYCNLEFDLDRGDRGDRTGAVEALLTRLTGAEASAVVNNNAAATILAVKAHADGREVIVSRGQLVEIGGSFRLPEIIATSGARLVEVGTTNRTRLDDYDRAIGPETAALLRVHPSNYRVVGFTEAVSIADLAALGRDRGLMTIDDIGSGALAPGLPAGIGDEPTAAGSIASGADLVLFSGDKLMGGPQCGIILGTRAAIGPVRHDPLTRAIRVDKLTLAALEATLRLALDPVRAASAIPLWALLAVPADRLMARAEALAGGFRTRWNLEASAVAVESFLGGGSAPGEAIASAAVRVGPPFPASSPSESAWARALRLGEPAVVARVRGGAVLLDLRAISEADDARLALAVGRATRPDAAG